MSDGVTTRGEAGNLRDLIVLLAGISRNYWWWPATVPCVGVPSLVLFITTACMVHFRCLVEVPTFSYAAEKHPEYIIFSTTMCVTSLLIASSTTLVCARMELLLSGVQARRRWSLINLASLGCGMASAVGLAGLAVIRMNVMQFLHLFCSYVFWFAQLLQYTLWISILARIVSERRGIVEVRWFAWQSFCYAAMTILGLAFAFSFFYVNKYIYADLSFLPFAVTSNVETLLEYSVVAIQLFFMGGFSHFLKLDDPPMYTMVKTTDDTDSTMPISAKNR